MGRQWQGVWRLSLALTIVGWVLCARGILVAAPIYVPQAAEYAPDANTVALWHLDETSGTTASDASANANHGALSNFGTPWSSATPRDQVGLGFIVGDTGSLSLDGVDDYVSVLNNPSLANFTNQMTIEAWIRPTGVWSGTTHWTIVRKFYQSPEDGGYLLRLNADYAQPHLEFQLFLGQGNRRWLIDTTTPVPWEQWSHVAAVYDGSYMRLYLNGLQVASQAEVGDIYVSNTDLTLGRIDTGHNLELFRGSMDEVRISNVALEFEAVPVGDVPEPCSLILLGAGILCASRVDRRRANRVG